MAARNLYSDTVEDVATVSNFRQLCVTHYHFDMDVDMYKQQIHGLAKLSFTVLQNTIEVRLDVHKTLTVSRVEYGNEREEKNFEIEPFTDYGLALHVKLGKEVTPQKKFDLYVTYVATGGQGVCWLEAGQTAGKKLPYMYTQGQAVYNRSFFPCQDTPAVKSTYTANVKVPDGFTPVMSASEKKKKGTMANLSGDKDNYYFNLPHPIPCYLIALAVGDLKSAEIGPRSQVWTEPCMLDDAKDEFYGVVEEFISTGEKLFGPYIWDTYDLLVMPPSFPFGGMENPCLTFVTPCLLVGDKSLTDVVIHEISHSWFGNLVTNANWSEFWLNEGFTMFAQRRIMSQIFGEAYTCLEAATGQALLQQHINETGKNHPLNRLRVIIEPGVDPEDTYNETPYEKGYAFVCYLQHLVGDIKTFDNFLKDYVAKFKFKSLVAEDTLGYFLEYFPKLKEAGVDKKAGFEFDSWLNTPGWPPYTPDLSAGNELTAPAENLAKYWAGQEKTGGDTDITTWKTYQVLHFLDKVLEEDKLKPEALSDMARQYPTISNTHNAEIRLRWSQLTIKHNYAADFPNVRKFLGSQGKLKYARSVYRALMKSSPETQKLAADIYTETKNQLHVTVKQKVEKILKGS